MDDRFDIDRLESVSNEAANCELHTLEEVLVDLLSVILRNQHVG